MGDMCLRGKLGVSMIGRSALYRCGAVFEGLWFFETYPGSPWGVGQVPIRLVLRSLGGRWITWKALQGREVNGIWC